MIYLQKNLEFRQTLELCIFLLRYQLWTDALFSWLCKHIVSTIPPHALHACQYVSCLLRSHVKLVVTQAKCCSCLWYKTERYTRRPRRKKIQHSKCVENTNVNWIVTGLSPENSQHLQISQKNLLCKQKAVHAFDIKSRGVPEGLCGKKYST